MGLLDRFNQGMNAVQTGLLGNPQVNPALAPYLSPGVMDKANKDARMQLGLAMLAASESGMGFGQGMMMAQQAAQQSFQSPIEGDLRANMTADALRRAQEQRDEQARRQAAQERVRAGLDGPDANLVEAAGESAYLPMLEAALNPTEAAKGPTTWEEFSRGEGFGMPDGPEKAKAYDAWLLRKTNAGATHVSQSVNGPFTKPGAEMIVGAATEAVGAGKAATSLITSANTIDAYLDAGAITGLGSDYRLDATRLGALTGVNSGASAKIANTEGLRSELANLAIAARQKMKGTGQISDYESKMIDSAAGRDPNISEAGIRAVLAVARRAGMNDINTARTKVNVLMAVDPELAKAKGVLDIPEPQQYQKNVKTDQGQAITVKLGVDGVYYYTDPKTNKRYRWEE